MDLSPGTRTRPWIGPPWRAVSGAGSEGVTGRYPWDLRPPTTQPRVPSSRRFWLSRRALCAIDRGFATSQVKHRFQRPILGTSAVAKPDLGTKRVCPDTGRKFYDLNKTPVISPYTGKVVPIAAPAPPRARAETAAPARPAPAVQAEAVVPETADAEFVSLEDAEAERKAKSRRPPSDGCSGRRGRSRDWRREPRRCGLYRGTGRRRRRRHRHHRRVDRERRGELIASAALPMRWTKFANWGHSSVGRAREWHSRGRRFDPPGSTSTSTLASPTTYARPQQLISKDI